MISDEDGEQRTYLRLQFILLFRISSEDESLGKQDTSPIVPRSAAQLRLRFLSRVGQEVSSLSILLIFCFLSVIKFICADSKRLEYFCL